MRFLSLFLFGLIAIVCVGIFNSAFANSSWISWLENGSYATYSLGEDHRAYLGFDDCAAATRVTGNYSWQCIEVDNDFATLKIEINMLINGSVTYSGKEFVNKAKANDWSFIKRIPLNQIAGRVEIDSDSVRISGPIYIHKELNVTVNLNTMELVDENKEAWGKWIMWINPLKYPLEGKTRETFIMSWLNITVDLDVCYFDESADGSLDTVLGKISRIFAASRFEPFENEFLLELEIIVQPVVVFTYIYDARSGILLLQETGTFLDDILTQKLGIIYTNGPFVLLETNVSIEQSDEFNFSQYTPYLAIMGIFGIIIGGYLIKKK